jgi:hypothetical protein
MCRQQLRPGAYWPGRQPPPPGASTLTHRRHLKAHHSNWSEDMTADGIVANPAKAVVVIGAGDAGDRVAAWTAAYRAASSIPMMLSRSASRSGAGGRVAGSANVENFSGLPASVSVPATGSSVETTMFRATT